MIKCCNNTLILPFRFPLVRVFQLVVLPHLCSTGKKAGPSRTDDGKCCSVQSQMQRASKGLILVMMSYPCRLVTNLWSTVFYSEQ